LEIQANQEITIRKTIERDGRNKCLEAFGFVSSPKKPLWENMELVLGNMTKFQYFNRPQQMAFHNLCSIKQPNKGIGLTLGLGLKFCIQSKLPKKDLTESFDRFVQDVRKRYIFAGRLQEETPKKIYKKSTTIFSSTEEHLEDRLTAFMQTLRNKKMELLESARPATNITKLQQQQLNLLRNNEEFIILNADKNLGPCIIERKLYIQNVLSEHLKNGNTYTNLSETEATERINYFTADLNRTLTKYRTSMNDAEYSYFVKSLRENHRIPQFYGMPKVHKNKIPVPLRPVISQCGSLSAVISTFIDYKLQPFTQKVPSYIKNSTSLLNQIDKLPTLPKQARIFTSDATSMYTNIDPDEGIEVLKCYLNEYNKEIKETVNVQFICKLLEIVMRNNIFQFGSTWWLQEVGTAMGTPCACIYATLFFAWFERQKILTKYKSNFLFYRRQIDDIFGIWVDDSRFPNRWKEFNEDLNGYCKLKWNTEPLGASVNFLDLTITINQGKLQYQTFQKPMNLFLYIPGHSAHPPGIVKSLIHGLVHTYYRQNSKRIHFRKNIRQLFGRLLVRGHLHNDIYPIFLEAAQAIDKKEHNKQRQKNRIQSHDNSNPNSSNNISRLFGQQERQDIFFHLPYHPKDITRRVIHDCFNKTCMTKDAMGENFNRMTNWEGSTMEVSKLTIAYSRGQNLRDLLCKTTLQEYDSCKVQQFI
jgi:hypothetical protein